MCSRNIEQGIRFTVMLNIIFMILSFYYIKKKSFILRRIAKHELAEAADEHNAAEKTK